MARYFNVTSGLRGCYMPDSAATIQADTHRELKAYLEEEARNIVDCGYVGANKRAVARTAAEAWATGNAALYYGHKTAGSYEFILEVSGASAEEYRQATEQPE